MECMLLPKNPTADLTKVPYVARQRYDGGEWFSYPERMDPTRPRILPDSSVTKNLHFKQMTTNELESFLQTWLLFGLLSEVIGGNSSDVDDPIPASRMQSVDRHSSSEVIDSIYEEFLFQDGDKCYVTTRTLFQRVERDLLRSLTDRQKLMSHCIRLGNCLKMTYRVLQVSSINFDPRIRASIAAVGELLAHFVNLIFSKLKIEQTCPHGWQSTFFRRDPVRHHEIKGPREIMLANGWCPSDISRSLSKFESLQMLHFLSMMARSHPQRNHQHCSDMVCTAYQIKSDYKLSHADLSCSCLPLAVDDSLIIEMLEDDTFPLLSFHGDMNDLRIEVVPFSPVTPYVAISHVWADGLGNQNANCLNRCQLLHLRKIAQAIKSEDYGDKNSGIFIWIDTLCCPIGPPRAKRKAIEKIRNVYQHARHVLVVDASIQAYDSRNIDVIEQLARIFTSGWMRRLWTLQEGALAESLYFQFADRALSLEVLWKEIELKSSELRHLIVARDFKREYLRIQAFFHADRFGHPGPDLNLLDTALQYRSVSVPSDEPLCIGTLMSLDLKQIVSEDVPENGRMIVVWKLLFEKIGGVPARVIFFPDKRIERHGWRWALASILKITHQLNGANSRILQWSDKQQGQLTPYGLHVRFSGFHVALNSIQDAKPHHPWRGVTQFPEVNLAMRDLHSGQWYMLMDQPFALMVKGYNDDGGDFHDTYEKFSLQDLLLSENCYIIEEASNGVAIIASSYSPTEVGRTEDSLQGIPVQTRRHVIFKPASQAQGIIYSSIETLAEKLRNDQLTDELLGIKDIESEEYKTLLKVLKQKMRDITAEAILQNPALGEAIDIIWDQEHREMIWLLIGDWYYHDFVGTKMPEGQMWYVD